MVEQQESPFDLLKRLIKSYDLSEVLQDLSTSNPAIWETCRNIAERYQSKQTQPNDEIKEKAKELVMQLSAPKVELSGYYFPGPRDVVDALKENNHYKTLQEPNNQGKSEPIYQYEEGRYIRAEERIKEDAHKEYIKQWEEMVQVCQGELNYQGKNVDSKVPALLNKLDAALHRGPSAFEIMEAMEMIRRTTFVDPESVNPHTHIPFRNGHLNLETWKLEPFDPERFYTYRIEADYLGRFVSLKDAPLFKGYVRSVFHPLDIPQALQYLGYSLMPGKPRDKVLFIVGREGIGKGVLDRLMEGLLGEGKGAIDLNKLLTADRFQFSGLDGKVLLSDPEIDRKFRRDAKVSTRNFNTLFGSDAAYTERKFHEGKKQVYHSKGLFLGNLPLFKLDDMAMFRRILLIQTLTERVSKDLADFHLKILESERDVIATLLVQYLRVLKSCDWVFLNEPTKESIADLWAQFADPIAGFEDEYLSEMQGSEVKVDDLYRFFEVIYCKPKGITPPRKQTFTSRIARNYPKVRGGPKGKRFYKFQNLECDGLVQDDSHRLDTSQIAGETQKITVSRDNRYGVQLYYKIVSPGGSRDITGDINTDIRWTPVKNDSPMPENKAPQKNEMVSNLENKPPNDPKEGIQKFIVIHPYNPDLDPLKRNLSCAEGNILEFDQEDEFGKLLRNDGHIVPFKESHGEETVKKLIEVLEKSRKKLGAHEISQLLPGRSPFLELTESEIFNRLVNLAGTHPNVKMANMKFFWEASK